MASTSATHYRLNKRLSLLIPRIHPEPAELQRLQMSSRLKTREGLVHRAGETVHLATAVGSSRGGTRRRGADVAVESVRPGAETKASNPAVLEQDAGPVECTFQQSGLVPVT